MLQGWQAYLTSLTPVADGISQRFVTFLVRGHQRPSPDDGGTVAEQAVEFTVTAALVPKAHGGPGLWLSFGRSDADLRLGSGWHLVVENQILDPIDLFIVGDLGDSFVKAGGAVGVKAEVRLERRGSKARPVRRPAVRQRRRRNRGASVGCSSRPPRRCH